MVRLLTIQDIERFYLGQGGHPFLDLAETLEIKKATGTVSTTTTGYFNNVYGALVWSQLNQEANVFGALPKTSWVRSGWRVKTAFATTYSSIAISETGSLPSAVYPSIQTVSTKPKVETLTFEVSDVMEQLAKVSEDDIWGSAHEVKTQMGAEFAKLLNQQLLHKVAEASAGNMLESIDRIVSSAAEETIVGVTGCSDVYGIDRSANSWADSQVLHNSGTNRALTDDLIRQLIEDTREAGANSTFWLTGYDTYANILGLYTTFVRYMPMSETQVSFGINGIKSEKGMNAGIQVASLYGIPLIQSVDTPADGSSRLYLLDTSDPEGYGLPRMSMSVLRPVEYFESNDFVLLDKYVIKGAYRFVGETIARFLAAQGKIRDLS